MNTTQTRSFDLALAEASRTAWNANAPKLGLYQNDFNPSPGMTTADLTPASYDDYAKLGVTFGPIFIDSGGQLTSIANREFYSPADGENEETIYGTYLENTVTGVLAAAKFPTTRPMGLPGQAIPLTLTLVNGILTLSDQN